MHRRPAAQFLFAGTLALALGGCTSFFGQKHVHRDASDFQVRVAGPDIAARTVSLTEQGRSELNAGMLSSAIVLFRQAIVEDEPIAPAINGLGVAYVKLGRLDLARRYFEQAIAADPKDARYSDNLARLEREELLLAAAQSMKMQSRTLSKSTEQVSNSPGKIQRLSRGEVMIRTASASGALKRPSAPALANVLDTSGQMKRVSRGEVRIVTAPPARASQNLAELDDRFKPLIRITFAEK